MIRGGGDGNRANVREYVIELMERSGQLKVPAREEGPIFTEITNTFFDLLIYVFESQTYRGKWRSIDKINSSNLGSLPEKATTAWAGPG